MATFMEWQRAVERIPDGDGPKVHEWMKMLYRPEATCELSEDDKVVLDAMLRKKLPPPLPQRQRGYWEGKGVGRTVVARETRALRQSPDAQAVAVPPRVRTRTSAPPDVRAHRRKWRKRWSCARFGLRFPAWIIDQLTAGQIAVANALGEIFEESYRAGHRLTCEHYVAQIARRVECSVRLVQQTVAVLIRLKVATCIHRRAGWLNGTNLLVPCQEWATWVLNRVKGLRVNGPSPVSRVSVHPGLEEESVLINLMEKHLFGVPSKPG